MWRDIRARVTEDAYDGWRHVADQNGVSISSLVEATGERLVRWIRDGTGMTTENVQAVIVRAREIDTERRRRR